MAHVLGRVTRPTPEVRGPDACYDLSLPGDWLDEGATIELELPRRVACAACRGGGCDACGRSGAVVLRGEDEPPERLPIALPRREVRPTARAIVLRIPERGGMLPERERTCRGLLLLRITRGDRAPGNVTRISESRRFERATTASGALGPVSRAPWVVLAIALLVAAVMAYLCDGP